MDTIQIPKRHAKAKRKTPEQTPPINVRRETYKRLKELKRLTGWFFTDLVDTAVRELQDRMEIVDPNHQSLKEKAHETRQ